MQPPQQPPTGGAPGPYYGYPAGPAGMPMMVNKRMVFVIIAVGALLLWIAQIVLQAFPPTDVNVRNFLRALYYTGAAIGFGGAVLGALGSHRTSDWQNVGLLILAGFFLLALA